MRKYLPVAGAVVRPISRIAATSLAVFALSACVSIGSGKVPATLLSLSAQAAPAPGSEASGSYAGAMAVLEPAAEARLAVLRVPVQIDDANVAYLKDAMWVERPARLLQRLMAETLRARGNRLIVENDIGGMNGLRLSSRLLDMGYDARSASAIVRLDAIKEFPGGKVETRRFESVVPGVKADAREVGAALNQAANAVAKDVADWVG